MKHFAMVCAALLLAVAVRAGEIQIVPANEFETLLQQKNVVLIDARRPTEFVRQHISGAQLLDVKNPNFTKQAKKINKKKILAVYCQKGVRSHVAAEKLDSMGYKVVELEGGLKAWLEQDKPVYEFPDSVTFHVEVYDIRKETAGADFRMQGSGSGDPSVSHASDGIATFCIKNESAHVSWGAQQRYMTLKPEDVISMEERKGEMILKYKTIDDVHVVTLYITLPGVVKIVLENTAGSEKWTFNGRITNQL